MKRVFAKILPDVPYVPLLYPNLGFAKRDSILFLNNAFDHLKEPVVELVDTPEEADAILLPHNYSSLKGKDAYIKEQADLAKRLNKKFIVFWHGDSDAEVPYDDAVVFRTSQYRSFLQKNETMMPAYAEDLLEGELVLRPKHSSKPIVGFCGWADYKNFKNRVGTLLKNSFIEAAGLFGVNHQARIKGITFRMKAVKHLQSSDQIQPNFIIRSSYSGHSETVKTDVQKTRQEYIENLLNSDYALVIKGDGNYSYRFYEALSLGRIPVLLDTECVLPLEDQIDYDSFILRVPYYDLYRLDQIIAAHWQRLSSEDFRDMQLKARDAFEKYLRVDRFLTRTFE